MGLTSLQVIQLTGNDIMGTIPIEIGMMRNLVELNIANTNLAGKIPKEIGLCFH
jgi:LRR receptor-like serine/threonine-protein kinase ERECTA